MAGALAGIKILELTRVAPGSFCTMMLADMGAEVIKIETPPEAQAKKGTGSGISPDASQARAAAFNFTNRNKQSIAINLRSPEGQRILQQLAADADVLIEGFRPGTMKRLGGDYETLRAINPRLVYCSLSGFGQDGPYRLLPGHDVNYLSFGGMLSQFGPSDQPPAIPGNIVADYASASLNGVIGILLALMARERTGKGQLVDISYLDGVIALTASLPAIWRSFMTGHLPPRGETVLFGAYPYYACYETKDGKYFTLGCMELHFWEHFCQAIGREDLIRFHTQPQHAVEAPDEEMRRVMAEMRGIFKTKTRDEWHELLKDKDVCMGPVLTWDEVIEDPQVRARNMVVEIDDPVAGRVKQAGIAIKLSETPGEIRRLGPWLGKDTAELLGALGYAADDVKRLREQGVVV